MNRTDLGLTQLDVGEPIADDNYSFQHVNPRLLNYYLRRLLGAKFDGAPGLANPTAALTGSVSSGTGQIPANTSLYLGYTLLDANGGETEIIAPPLALTSAPPLADPTAAPTAATDYTAGSLLAGDFSYAVTLTDGQGGETAVGPAVTVTIPSGHANARVLLTGLAAILAADPGAVHWRVYRIQDGGSYHFLNEGVGDAMTDDGSFPVQCIDPPATGTTKATSAFEVTVPAGQDVNAVSANLYASADGSFQDPALLQNVLAVDFGTVLTLDSIVLNDGSPPVVNTSLANRPKIDPDTELLGVFKKPVATIADLPAVGNGDGDMREVLVDHSFHVWDGATWSPLAGSGGGDAMSIGDVISWTDPAFPGYHAVTLTGEASVDEGDTLITDAIAGMSGATFAGDYTELPSGAAIEVVAGGAQGTNAQAGLMWAAVRTGSAAPAAEVWVDFTPNGAGWGWIGAKLSPAADMKGVLGRVTEAGRLQLAYYLGADVPPTAADWTVFADVGFDAGQAIATGDHIRVQLQYVASFFRVQVLKGTLIGGTWEYNTEVGVTTWIAMPGPVNGAWGVRPNVLSAIAGAQTAYAEATVSAFTLTALSYDTSLNVAFTDPAGSGSGYTVALDVGAWATTALDAGWTVPAGARALRARQEGQDSGTVRLDGQVKGAVSGAANPICVLPSPPAHETRRVVAGDDAAAVIVIQADGTVYLQSGTGATYLDFGGVTYTR